MCPDKVTTIQRLLLVDDHPIIAQGLKLFLDRHPDIEMIGAAEDGRKGLEILRTKNPDIVLLDLAMPGLDGIESIRLYLNERPEVKIIVFTGIDNDVHVYQALEAGACGYILKGGSMAKVLEAIREVGRGGYWLSPELNHCIIKSFVKGIQQDPDVLEDFRSLTKREQQVFRLLAGGKSTAEVADTLCISPKTVAKHRVAVKSKLNLNNVADMANYAMSIGLIHPQAAKLS
ncbi:MAG TPA: response regulator transcription factor [Pelovirga sp.]|nr:response regulator transcription factor [Pelovirga sp.]